MTPTSPVISPAHRRGASRESDVLRQRRHARSRRAHSGSELPPLGRYVDREGHARELVARPGAAGSTLVVDRDGATGGDPRLVAHLAADEPAANAALVCSRYLEDLASGGGRCRALTAEDGTLVPFDERQELEDARLDMRAAAPVDRRGFAYSLGLVHGELSIPELRWCRRRRLHGAGGEPISVRETIASLESYEPVRTLTLHALSRRGHDVALSTTVLRAELARVHESPIILNRRLREVVLASVERQQLSMSEIAIRCGRVKRDRKGNESGETSWLARRIGLLPEGGRSTPTPWIHSDVLALIARHGLGVSPREVELC